MTTKRKKITVPDEVYTRLDDVAYELASDSWDKLPADQQARVREEAVHLVDLIQAGDNWYGNDSAGQRAAQRDLRETQRFLAAIGPAPATFPESAFRVGDRVEAGAAGTDEHDTGRILAIDGAEAWVGWGSGVKTSIPLEQLRRW